MASAPPTWDPQRQLRELNEWRRHQESLLLFSGMGLALVNALLAFEVLSVNEDTDTFFVVGALNLAMISTWILIARGAAARSKVWALKARRIELELLRIPEHLEAGNALEEGGLPAWIAGGLALVGFAVLWAGLIAYAFWWAYLAH
jgi:hypothetical protein